VGGALSNVASSFGDDVRSARALAFESYSAAAERAYADSALLTLSRSVVHQYADS
jgi:hypothetical protein